MEYITQSSDETQKLGKEIGHSLKGGEIFALSGDLGAGKTTFIQGLAQGLEIEATITSPTFILMRSYSLPKKEGRTATHLYHLDLYRLDNPTEEDISNLGIYDLWGHPSTIFVIEWSERLANLPSHAKRILIQQMGENSRKITID